MGEKILFTNITGSYVFDDRFKVVGKGDEKELMKKHSPKQAGESEIKKILPYFKDKKYFELFYRKNLLLTKQKIKESVKKDALIIQTIDHINELHRMCNILAKRLREWYSYYLPEFVESIKDHEKLAELMISRSRKNLLAELKLDEKQTMGAELGKEELNAIMSAAEELKSLFKLKEKQTAHLEKEMKALCPNILAITGALIGAKLLSLAGSLKSMALMPASKVQLLGAEKALFRHLRTKAKCPKYGVIHEHPFISQAKRKNHGKVARLLADKISMAAKVDYFKGEFIGEKLKKEIEDRIGKLK